jgi:hypothetical protein
MKVFISSTLLKVLVAVAFACEAIAGVTDINFDPPNFIPGQVVTAVSGVTFPDSPVIFVPTEPPHSPPYALRSAQPCLDTHCSNNAYQHRMIFDKGMSRISLRAGSEYPQVGEVFNCMPEGTEVAPVI